MSRFFATASDSETETESSDGEEIAPKAAVIGTKTFQWSDDEEDTKRVVRSAKDKRFEELENVIKNLRNHKKIKDMANVLSDFEELGRVYERAKKVVGKDGIPRFYIRCLAELEDFVNECWEDREGRKTMSKNNSKGLATLRQKLRRYLRDFESDLTSYRENPDLEEKGADDGEEEEEESESESEDEDIALKFRSVPKEEPKKPTKAPKPPKDESESDDSLWGDDSDSDSSSSDEEGHVPGQLTADYFRKKVPAEGDTEKKKRDKEKKRERQRVVEEEDGEGWEEVPSKGGSSVMQEKPKLFPKDTEITLEAVLKKQSELVGQRGKKGTDRLDQIDLFVELRAIAAQHNLGLGIDAKILFNIISAIFSYNPNIATCMKAEMFEKCIAMIQELLKLLTEQSDSIIAAANVDEDSENYDGPLPYRIRGCLLSTVERFDEEYTKMLQACDAHSTEYVERLKDERTVCKILQDLELYLEKRGTTEEMCRLYIKRVEHMYYRLDQYPEDQKPDEDSSTIVDRLCKYIYVKDTTDRIRTRAILCHIYHHALHGRWFEARDLMLMSHLQDTIQHSDIPTQILYNRAMVQLGLCAFRKGMVKDAHSCLVDIQSSGRAKELLAQGLLLQRQHERTPEQEKIEKRRQMPYHMHINLELLECVYLVSAMLLEIPYMAAHEFDARRRMISKNFHHVLRVSERQPLVGPPESMREHVVAASKAMKKGDWRACVNFLINDKMNTKVWDLFNDADRARQLIRSKVQEEALRTYLFTYSAVYDSLSMDILAGMFELTRESVHSIISKMIINEELMASLEQPTHMVIMHRTEPSRLQSLALQLSEKVSSLVEYNEKLSEAKHTGGFYNTRDYHQQDRSYRRDNRRDNDRGKRRGDRY